MRGLAFAPARSLVVQFGASLLSGAAGDAPLEES